MAAFISPVVQPREWTNFLRDSVIGFYYDPILEFDTDLKEFGFYQRMIHTQLVDS